jgi:hypothetical protein
MLLLIMGLCDITYQAYIQAVLTGAVQKAGRDGSIQDNAGTAAGATLDDRVMRQIKTVAGNATGQSARTSFAQFSYIAGEPYEDNNGNNAYDAATECFTDVNGNGVRDAQLGTTGQGGANDAVLYTMTVKYNRLFPLATLVGWSQRATITASTILKNQPYATQNAPKTNRVCPP